MINVICTEPSSSSDDRYTTFTSCRYIIYEGTFQTVLKVFSVFVRERWYFIFLFDVDKKNENKTRQDKQWRCGVDTNFVMLVLTQDNSELLFLIKSNSLLKSMINNYAMWLSEVSVGCYQSPNMTEGKERLLSLVPGWVSILIRGAQKSCYTYNRSNRSNSSNLSVQQ